MMPKECVNDVPAELSPSKFMTYLVGPHSYSLKAMDRLKDCISEANKHATEHPRATGIYRIHSNNSVVMTGTKKGANILWSDSEPEVLL